MADRFLETVNKTIEKLDPQLQALVAYDNVFPEKPIFVAKGTFIDENVIPLFKIGNFYYCILGEDIVVVESSMKTILFGYKVMPISEEEKQQMSAQYNDLIANDNYVQRKTKAFFENFMDDAKEVVYKIVEKSAI